MSHLFLQMHYARPRLLFCGPLNLFCKPYSPVFCAVSSAISCEISIQLLKICEMSFATSKRSIKDTSVERTAFKGGKMATKNSWDRNKLHFLLLKYVSVMRMCWGWCDGIAFCLLTAVRINKLFKYSVIYSVWTNQPANSHSYPPPSQHHLLFIFFYCFQGGPHSLRHSQADGTHQVCVCFRHTLAYRWHPDALRRCAAAHGRLHWARPAIWGQEVQRLAR